MVINADCRNVKGNQGEVDANLHSTAHSIEHNMGVWAGKPDCSEMEMTQFIFISVQSSFPAQAFK